jgi:phenylacetate-coenzyme A ligase PaaK-like adenylate-forming protein
MADPERFRLQFETPSLYDQTHSLMYTTGTTTGRPTLYPLTGHDMMGSIEGMARGMKQAYFVPGDIVVSAFPYSPTAHLTTLSPHYFNSAGCAFLACFTGAPYDEFHIHNTQAYVADALERMRGTIIIGVASFVRRMARDAARQGRDFSSVRIAYISGEVCTERMRDDVRASLRRCGAEAVFVTTPYAFTEAALAWTECRELGWWHLAAPDQIHCEVVDPRTHEPVAAGTRGLLVITHLNRRGVPLVRYAPGDLSAVVEEPCPDCGRFTQSMVITEGSTAVARTHDLAKIKGTLINPQVLASVVGNTEGVLEYQIVFDRRDHDDPLSDEVLIVRVATDGDVDEAALQERLRGAVFEASELRPSVEFVPASEIFDPSVNFKAVRIVDRRPREA